MAVRFINCDLEVEGPRSLEHILAHFLGTEIHNLSYLKTGRGCFANFELSFYNYSDPNSIIVGFCDVIENLRDDARATWNDAYCRKLDLGYESDIALGFVRSELKAETVRRAAALGASIVVTIYTKPVADLDMDCPQHEETNDGCTVR